MLFIDISEMVIYFKQVCTWQYYPWTVSIKPWLQHFQCCRFEPFLGIPIFYFIPWEIFSFFSMFQSFDFQWSYYDKLGVVALLHILP
jgi:hypothetical protein